MPEEECLEALAMTAEYLVPVSGPKGVEVTFTTSNICRRRVTLFTLAPREEIDVWLSLFGGENSATIVFSLLLLCFSGPNRGCVFISKRHSEGEPPTL